MRFSCGSKSYIIRFYYQDNYSSCTIESIDLIHSKNIFGFGEAVKHPKDVPNRVVGRRVAFERAIDDFKQYFKGKPRKYKEFYQNAWLCFVNSVNGRL